MAISLTIKHKIATGKTMRTQSINVILLTLLPTFAAIANSCSSATTCTAGDTRTCVGPGTCEGGQMCNSDGSGWGACICASTGGAPSAGGSTATGGNNSGGNTNLTSAGGAPAATNGPSGYCDGNIDIPAGNLTVSSDGYVTVGELQGDAYTYTWSNEGSETVHCIKASYGPSALCAVGYVEADPTWWSGSDLGFFVNDAATADASISGIPVRHSITVTTHLANDEAGNSELFLEIADTNNNWYCVTPSSWTSGKPTPIESFNTSCGNDSGVYAKPGTQIQRLDIGVFASNEVALPFAFCITDVTVQ